MMPWTSGIQICCQKPCWICRRHMASLGLMSCCVVYYEIHNRNTHLNAMWSSSFWWSGPTVSSKLTEATELGCVSLRFKGLPEGHRWGFPYLKNSKNCTKNLNTFFTSRWPGAKSAPGHQLAKKLYLRLWGHFKDRKPPPWASQNGEFPVKGPILGMHPWPHREYCGILCD